MTQDELRKIVFTAFNAFYWASEQENESNLSLPEYLTNRIFDAQPTDAIAQLRDKLDKAELEIARQLRDIENWGRSCRERDAVITRLRFDYDAAMEKQAELSTQLDNVRAAAPHYYMPSTTHMGDCITCGNGPDAPQHITVRWKDRALKAEDELKLIKKTIRDLLA